MIFGKLHDRRLHWKYNWHWWFAWYPVGITHSTATGASVWLQWILRKKDPHRSLFVDHSLGDFAPPRPRWSAFRKWTGTLFLFNLFSAALSSTTWARNMHDHEYWSAMFSAFWVAMGFFWASRMLTYYRLEAEEERSLPLWS